MPAKKQIKGKSKPKPNPKSNRMKASNAFGNCQWRQGIIEARQGRISLSLSLCLYPSVSLRQLLIALPSLVSCLLGRDVISITEKKLPPETKQHRVRNEASAEASAKSRLDAICLMLKLLITHTLRGSRNEQKL